MKKILLGLAALTLSLAGYAQAPVLNHIAVYVHDLKKSTDFYRQLIGFDTIPNPFGDGKHVWFAIGGRAALHLISGAAAATPHDKNSHFCFSVPSMAPFLARLTRAGVAYEDWLGKPQAFTTRADGVHQAYFTDPDGWWIEVNDAK